MAIVETFHGYVETTRDSLILLEASRRGILPRVRRRLQEQERQLIKSGAVFCFNENESGIKRWTDGLVWSPSRILGNFLIYRELDDKKNSDDQVEDPQLITSGLTLLSKRQKERALFGSLRSTYRFKPNGLIKKSMSLVVNGVQLHLISYYNKDDVLANKFKTPSDIPELASIEISPELLRGQNFRIPFYLDDAPNNNDQSFEENKKSKISKNYTSDKSVLSTKQKRRVSYMQLTSSRSTSRSSISSNSSCSTNNNNNNSNPSTPTSFNQNPLVTPSLSSSLSSISLSPQERHATYSQSPQSYDIHVLNSSSPSPSPSINYPHRHHHQQQRQELNITTNLPLSSTSSPTPFGSQSDHSIDYQQNSYSRSNSYQFNENAYIPSHSTPLNIENTSSSNLHHINSSNENNHSSKDTEKNNYSNLFKRPLSYSDNLSNQGINSPIQQVSEQTHIPHSSVGVGSDYHYSHYVPHSFSTGYSTDRYEQNPHQHLFSSTSFHAVNHASLHTRTELVSNAYSIDQAALLGLGWNDFEMQL